MRLAFTLLAVVSLAALAPPSAPAAPEDHRAWVGTIAHDLSYTPSAFATVYRTLYGEPECHGTGVGVVHVDLVAGTFELVNPDSACIPGYTTLSQGCALHADEHVRCERIVGAIEIRVDVAPDGAFDFTYDDPGHFYEHIYGSLTRVA